MITPDDIEVVGAYMRFLDDPKDKSPVAVNIGIIKSKEEDEALSAGIMSDDKDWYAFDSWVFAYVHKHLGETIDEYYSEETTPNDFILIREEELEKD
jgi:hypothetical protein